MRTWSTHPGALIISFGCLNTRSAHHLHIPVTIPSPPPPPRGSRSGPNVSLGAISFPYRSTTTFAYPSIPTVP